MTTITNHFLIALFFHIHFIFFHSSVTTGPPYRRLRPADGGDGAGGEDPLPLRLQRYGRHGRLQVLSFNGVKNIPEYLEFIIDLK